MILLNRVLFATSLIGSFLTGSCLAEPQFRLGISGQNALDDANGGFVISSLDQGSPLLTLRDEGGQISSAEPGDRVITLNQQPFSPAKLQEMQNDLLANNGVVELGLFDRRTGNTIHVSAILRRADIDSEFRRDFRKIVREEYEGLKRNEVTVREGPNSIVGVGLASAFAPQFGSGADSPMSVVVTCQLGIDQIRATAQANQFAQMIPPGTYNRAAAIVANAVAAISFNSSGEDSQTIADNAHAAVVEEFRIAFQSYARRNGKQWREENRYAAGFFRFRPVTMPPELTVEVIPSADVKILLRRNPPPSTDDIEQLSGWTPLPADAASIYGRFFYRLRDPTSGRLLSSFQRSKLVVIIAEPANGEIFFP